MNGIERFSKQEKAFAEQIRSKARQVRELEDDPNHDQAKLDELGNAINWDRRIFEERRKTISYVCEVPTVDRATPGRARPRDPTVAGMRPHSPERSPGRGAGFASVSGSPASAQPSVPSGYQATLT